jgi:hypothetical protein
MSVRIAFPESSIQKNEGGAHGQVHIQCFESKIEKRKLVCFVFSWGRVSRINRLSDGIGRQARWRLKVSRVAAGQGCVHEIHPYGQRGASATFFWS